LSGFCIRLGLVTNSTVEEMKMFKNWKTSLLGIVAAVCMVFGTAAQNRVNNPSAPPITAGNVLPAVVVAALGAAAKDHSN
jgi:drug/metabolite transporter (DMT)-like permease